nr:MAG TPA: hypothetical protein [Caudoviricetes sp.]
MMMGWCAPVHDRNNPPQTAGSDRTPPCWIMPKNNPSARPEINLFWEAKPA